MKFHIIPQTKELYDTYDFQVRAIKKRGDSGFDLFTPQEVIIPSKSTVLIDLKVKVQLVKKRCILNNKYFSYMMMPRSSICKTPLIMANSIGLIDSSYTGNLKVPVFNTSDRDYIVNKDTRLVQLIMPNLEQISKNKVKLLECNFLLNNTERGQGGFGSTGQ